MALPNEGTDVYLEEVVGYLAIRNRLPCIPFIEYCNLLGIDRVDHADEVFEQHLQYIRLKVVQ
jgi:hypothetical protein